MTTVADALYRIRAKVYGAQRIELNQLTNGIVASQTAFALTYETHSLQYGSVISVGAESMFVWEYDTTTQTVTVTRGWNGTTAIDLAAATEVEINVRFPSPEILAELHDEIAGWPASLYRLVAANHDLATTPGSVRLDPLLEGCYGIVDVRHSPDATTQTTWPRVLSADLVHQMDTDDFDTADMLSVNDSLTAGLTIRVIAALPFDTETSFTTTTDLVEEVGLATSMVDLAILGVAIRLTLPQEIKRSSRSGADEPRIAGEVPPGGALQTGQGLVRIYDQRLKTEASKLAARYPIRFS